MKWAGGKGKILPILKDNLPADFERQNAITYIEPFVGGGAMLFYMLEHYSNINRIIINDVNPALINCYKTIKKHHNELIVELQRLSNAFVSLSSDEDREEIFYAYRDEYNLVPFNRRKTIRSAALFIFLNRTCFNGLYRENSKGNFNVPYGRYIHPTICNATLISDIHKKLENVEILNGDYTIIMDRINWTEYNFFYFDPPYRPLLGSNNFRQYTRNIFGDQEQEALKRFCDQINDRGGRFMLSNSNSEIEPGVNYFERLYENYDIRQIFAPRTINAFVPGVEIATEILVKNY